VILLTAFADIHVAVESIKEGALDFIVKPWQNEKLLATVKAANTVSREKGKVKELKSRQRSLVSALEPAYEPLIGTSEAINEIRRMIEKVAPTEAEVLILGANGTGKEVKGLEAIKVRSEGLHAFTQSYRQLASTPKVSLQDTSIHALVQRVSLLMEPKMCQKSIRFEVTGDDADITVDPHLIEQVLINLLENAIEAVSGKNDAFIHLRTSRNNEGQVCIHVSDNGKGMDAATAENIFIPFFTTRKNGSGIGLAITKQILQLHHADLQFTTEEGHGSEFIIAFAPATV
jgi:signal transduction histidine kinase